MKPFIYLFIALGMLMHTSQAQQQKRFYIEPYARPFLYPLMNPTKSVGENYNDVKYVKQFSSEFGINAGVRVWKNLSIGVGYNRMQIKHLLTWQDYDINEPKHITNAGKHLAVNQSYYGLKLQLKYTLPKWYFEANISYNEPRLYNAVRQENIQIALLFPPDTSYTIAQDILTIIRPSVIPEIIAGYSLTKNLYIHAGLKTKWYGKHSLAHLQETLQKSGTTRSLTDINLMDKYVMLSFGLSYHLRWNFKL